MSKTMTPSEIAEALEARHKYDKINYPPASPLDRQAAATIRELEALGNKRIKAHQETLERERVALTKLKIATEALESGKMSLLDGVSGFERAEPRHEIEEALARIKEVGA